MSTSNRTKIKFILVLLFIPLLLVFIWFRKGLIFAGGEDGISFYDPARYLIYVKYIWNEVNTGYPILFNLPRIPFIWVISYFYNLGINPIILQAFTFFALMSTGSIAVFYLIEEIFISRLKHRLTSLTSFVGAIFYLLNPYSMTQVWGRGLYFQFFAFALVPLFLLFFILSIKHRDFVYSVFGLLASFIFSSMFVSPTQSLVFWTPVFIFFTLYFIDNVKDKKKLSFAVFNLLFIFIFWILIHAWWIIPNATIGTDVYTSILNDTASNVGTLEGVSRSYPLLSIIRLIHNGPFYQGKYYGEIYISPPFIVLSWLIPIISIFSLKFFKKLPYFKFYFCLFLTSLFICLGANPPTGFIFVWIFKNVPLLQAFRNPFEKFGVVFLMAYTPFFALGTLAITEKIKNIASIGKLYLVSPAIILFLISGVFSWPMWYGNFAGGYKFNPWVNVPEYYQSANRWLNENGEGYRILHIPLIPGDGVQYLWTHPYQGVEPSNFFFDRSSVSRQAPFGKEFYNLLLEKFGGFIPNIAGHDPDLANSEFKSNLLSDELIRLNVKHIVLHNDLDAKYSAATSIDETKLLISNQKDIKKVKTFGDLDIYEVGRPNMSSLIYSPGQNLDYTKINPTVYKVSIEIQKPFQLYFLTLYSDNWEAFVNGKKVLDHFRLFSYANAWNINQSGKLDITIKYKPQDAVSDGWRISIITLSIGCLYILWKKRFFGAY